MPLPDIFNWTLGDLLGIPRPRDSEADRRRQEYTHHPYNSDDSEDAHNIRPFENDPRKLFERLWDDSHSEDHGGDFGGSEGHDIFNETREIHRHMEQQMSELMKMFGMNIFGLPTSPFLENENMYDDQNEPRPAVESSIRDQYLKPGYQVEQHNSKKAVDSDLDGVIDSNDLRDFIVKDRDNPNSSNTPDRPKTIVPSRSSPNYFGRVIITQTVTKPDGTVETRRTVKDSRTNEEETTVTITQKDGRNPFDKPIPIYPNDESGLWQKFFKF